MPLSEAEGPPIEETKGPPSVLQSLSELPPIAESTRVKCIFCVRRSKKAQKWFSEKGLRAHLLSSKKHKGVDVLEGIRLSFFGDESVVRREIIQGSSEEATKSTKSSLPSDLGLLAAANGDIAGYSALIEGGYSPNTVDQHGSSACCWAAGSGKVQFLKYLLDHVFAGGEHLVDRF